MNGLLVISVLLGYISYSLGDGISFIGPDKFEIGTDGTLQCRVSGLENPQDMTVFWSKDGKKIGKSLKNANDSFIYKTAPANLENRFFMYSEGFGAGEARATIERIQIEDAGTYNCDTESGRISFEKSFNIIVYNTPTVTIAAVNRDLDIRPKLAEENKESKTDELPTGPEDPTGADTSVETSSPPPADTTTVAEPSEPKEVLLANCYVENAYPKPKNVTFTQTKTGVSFPVQEIHTLITNDDGTFTTPTDNPVRLYAVPTPELNGARITCSVEYGLDKPAEALEPTETYDVKYPPSEVTVSFSDNEPTEDDPVTVNCIVNGNPKPTPMLTLPDHQIKTPPFEFRAKRQDKGKYTCTVSTNVDRPFNNSAKLSINWLDSPIIEGSKLKTMLIGDSITLSCSALGSPKPRFFWKKDGEVYEGTTEDNGKTLTIDSLTYEDKGKYTCEARGAIDLSTEADLMVHGGCNPTMTKLISASSKKEDAAHVQLVCTSAAVPACHVEIVDEEGNVLESGDGEVTYTNDAFQKRLSPMKVKCVASNSVKSATYDVVLDGPEFIKEAPPRTGGVGIGVIIIIIILVALVVVGIPLGCYLVKRRNAAKGKNVKEDPEKPAAESEKLNPDDNNQA